MRGGVSSWCHQLIRGLPDLKFSLITMVPSQKDLKMSFELPDNVVDLEEVVLCYPDPGLDEPYRMPRAFMDRVEKLHSCLKSDPKEALDLSREFLTDPFCVGPENHQVVRSLSSPEAWELLLRLYKDRGMESCSFNAYFYTFLHSHFRFFRALRARYPVAKVYHAVSTGYAGIVSVAASLNTGRPLLLTEHGIYTNERNMDITMLDWIEGGSMESTIDLSSAPSKIRGVWMKFFEFMGQLTYDQASVITTLFQGNLNMQVAFGADPDKIRIIPNGVNYEKLSALPEERDPNRPRICLIGRVVPIKDIRTFIKACALVARERSDCSFEILGPTEEDPIYYEGCMELVKEVGIQDQFTFAGHVDLSKEFSSMTVGVLTSMSEGLPLVMLETMACGVPNVASRVGACEELIVGRDERDAILGSSGIVTGVGSPEETAKGILRLLDDPLLYTEMGKSSRKRVERYYDQVKVLAEYREIYDEMSARPDAPIPVFEGGGSSTGKA